MPSCFALPLFAIRVSLCLYVCICMYVCTYVCTYVCLYVYDVHLCVSVFPCTQRQCIGSPRLCAQCKSPLLDRLLNRPCCPSRNSGSLRGTVGVVAILAFQFHLQVLTFVKLMLDKYIEFVAISATSQTLDMLSIKPLEQNDIPAPEGLEPKPPLGPLMVG